MQLSRVAFVAGLLAVAGATPCKPQTWTPTLPSTGTGTDLPAPSSSLTLLKIALGHGLQNYTCANSSATVVNTGALAVLYDVTALYPGTIGTGLLTDDFASLTSSALWQQDMPLNLQNTACASPGTTASPNTMAESLYGAVVANPFPTPAAALQLKREQPGATAVPFLGHHYFDSTGVPTFDLSLAGLLGKMKKTGDVKAPTTADKGILSTGAVDWLQLSDNGKGLSRGVKAVYRVLTAGGVSQSCSTLVADAGSVPYTAMYWFYG